jgi:hypothetical protein
VSKVVVYGRGPRVVGCRRASSETGTGPQGITSLRSEVMDIGTLMPHLLGVAVWDGGALAPEGADALCPHHLEILPSLRAAWGAGHNVRERK